MVSEIQSRMKTKPEGQTREMTAGERRDRLIGIKSNVNRLYSSFLQQTRYNLPNTLCEKRRKKTHFLEEGCYNPYRR